MKTHRNAPDSVEIPFPFSPPSTDESITNFDDQSTMSDESIDTHHTYECYVCKLVDFPDANQLQKHLHRHIVHKPIIDPMALTNWDVDELSEIISNQPLVMAENLNMRNVNLSSLNDFCRTNPNSIVDMKVENLETAHNDYQDVVEILSDSDEEDFETIRYRLNNNARLNSKETFSLVENNGTGESVYISSDDEGDITDSFHCFYCNGRFVSLNEFGAHEKVCYLKPELDL